MNKLIDEIRRQWRAMLRYRWAGLLSAWTVAMLGMVIVLALPKKYEASARVFVNTDSLLKPLMVGVTVQPDTSQRVALLSRLIISRPNVARLLDETSLGAGAKSPEMRERLIDHVSQALEIQSHGERDNTYLIKFRDTQPARAQQMVALLVARFINLSQGGADHDTQATRQFLDAQTATYEARLKSAERRLQEFKLRTLVAGDNLQAETELASNRETLDKARADLQEARSEAAALQRAVTAAETSAQAGLVPRGATGSVGAPAPRRSELDLQIAAVQRELSQSLAKYTTNHPDVVVARRHLRELEQQRTTSQAATANAAADRNIGAGDDVATAAGPASVASATTTGEAGSLRAAEQMMLSQAQAEVRVAALTARVEGLARRSEQLQRAARAVPKLEAEQAELNRDYEINKKNYDSLVSRRESANIGGDMRTVAGMGDFRVIDPPRVAPGAVSTSRAVLLVFSLTVALAIGVSTMFFSKQLRARVHDTVELAALSTLPILGAISSLPDAAAQRARRRSNQRFVATASVLLCLYAGLLGAGLVLQKTVT